MQTRARRIAAAVLVALATQSAAPLAEGVPFWGARASEPIGTDSNSLKPGQFVWDADAAPKGPLVMIVSLPEQRARVYRNGIRIGVAAVSTGRPGHLTPTGIFTILNKDKDHMSKKYNNAPMPYSERLTWDGIALHAGGLPGYPSSHGCVHLPSRFAELLFGLTDVGMTVVIADDKSAAADVSHPPFIAPVNPKTGADDLEPRLPVDVAYRFDAKLAETGPITIVVSRADLRVLVLRNGLEIGRAKIVVEDPDVPLGTSAFILRADASTAPSPDSPAGTRWIGVLLPGSAVRAGAGMTPEKAARVQVPPEFAAAVLGILTPGATLYVTDAAVLPQAAGTTLNVVNSDPPSGQPAP
jgi:hypothetical protein